MKSIRFFLLAGLLATLTLFNFVAALRGYQSSMREAEVLFDNELLDVARLISRLDARRVEHDFRLGNNLAFQLWLDGELAASSFHAPGGPITAFRDGFDYSNFNGYRWRTYARREPPGDRWVMVAERSDLRFVLAENVVLESVFPILLSIPLVGLLAWLIISHGLRPLRILTAQLKSKQAGDLSPLGAEDAPRELAQVVESINGFIGRLAQALEREKRFSADAAHELRTPISALKVQLHNLGEDLGTDGESYRQLRGGVERMQHLVEQLLSLSRMSPDRFAVNQRRLDLYQVAQTVIARQYCDFEGKGQSLELTGDACFIQGDEFALDTMIANLLGNANKYTPAGGRILVRVEHGTGEGVLVVEDDGPGIPARERQRIFDRFYRGARAEEETLPGCGLGLALVRQVAELHRARLSVEDSGFGRGTAFRVSFPLENEA